MLKFISKLTGNVMYVAEDRKEEYLAAGHKLAVEEVPAVTRTEEVKKAPKKATAKKKK